MRCSSFSPTGTVTSSRSNVLKDGFIDCKTKAPLGGKKYPGLILPLELGREFHEREYLTYGSIQSAKLVVKRREEARRTRGSPKPNRPLPQADLRSQFNAGRL